MREGLNVGVVGTGKTAAPVLFGVCLGCAIGCVEEAGRKTGGTGNTTTGTGGSAGGGTGGTTGGGAGMAGTGGTGPGDGSGMDAGDALLDVAKVLNGQMLLGPCQQETEAFACAAKNGACPPPNTADRALSGVLMTDKTVTLGGTTDTDYTITLHIQGEVESKAYGGMDQNSTATSPKADGWCVGGTPVTTDAYAVYMIRVTNPGAAKTDYFLNSLQPPGASNHTTYGIDYMASIKAKGGASIRLVLADSNCSMTKNCGPDTSDTTCRAPIVLKGVEPEAIALNPTFDFNAAYKGQWVVMTVKNVTSP